MLEPVAGRATGSGSHDTLPIRTGVWPARVINALCVWCALCGALVMPGVLGGASPFLTAAAAVPVLLSALLVRLTFESLGTSASGDRSGTWPLAAAMASVIGASVATASEALLGLDVAPPAAGGSVGAVFLTLAFATRLRAREERRGAASRRVFFIGSEGQIRDLAREARGRWDMGLVGSVTSSAARREDHRLEDAVLDAGATTLVMSSEAIRDERLVATASRLNLSGVRVRVLESFYEEEFRKVPLSELSPSWFLFDIAEIHRAGPYSGAKRVIETTVAAAALIVTAPLFPVIAVAIRISTRGPVFFRQIRVGRDDERFTLTKFRTMTVASDQDAGWVTDHSHRITPVGRLLRRFRLDELPQLIHVVRGQLSLVGPRPEQPAIVDRLEQELEFYAARHTVRPGLTGWAQINYGYGGSDVGVIEKLQYDFFYIKHQSLRLDLLTILATVRTILGGRGA